MIRIQRILYPTDFSSFSNQAYFHAIALAAAHRASLTVLFVYHPEHCPLPAGASTDDPREFWREQLEQIRPIDGAIPVNHVLLEGDPATEIVRYGRDAGINLIVMGTHGRSGYERLVLGSVAEKVLAEAGCSVLVVKMPRGIPTPQADFEVAAAR